MESSRPIILFSSFLLGSRPSRHVSAPPAVTLDVSEFRINQVPSYHIPGSIPPDRLKIRLAQTTRGTYLIGVPRTQMPHNPGGSAVTRSCSRLARATSVSRRSSVNSVFMSFSHPAPERHESASHSAHSAMSVLARCPKCTCISRSGLAENTEEAHFSGTPDTLFLRVSSGKRLRLHICSCSHPGAHRVHLRLIVFSYMLTLFYISSFFS